MLVCSLHDAMVGSLSVAAIAVSATKVAVVVFGEVGRTAVYYRCSNGPRTVLWITFAGNSCV
jgi:propanediol dehydratase large subunit